VSLASRHGVAVILVHHTRKADADDALDTVSGTLGLTGAPDTIIVLRRQHGAVTLYGRGRDIEELEKALVFDHEHFKWDVRGNAAEVRVSDERATIAGGQGSARSACYCRGNWHEEEERRLPPEPHGAGWTGTRGRAG